MAIQRPMLEARLAALRGTINDLEAKLRFIDDSPTSRDSASASLGSLSAHPYWAQTIAEIDTLLTRISTERTGIIAIRDALAAKFGVSP